MTNTPVNGFSPNRGVGQTRDATQGNEGGARHGRFRTFKALKQRLKDALHRSRPARKHKKHHAGVQKQPISIGPTQHFNHTTTAYAHFNRSSSESSRHLSNSAPNNVDVDVDVDSLLKSSSQSLSNFFKDSFEAKNNKPSPEPLNRASSNDSSNDSSPLPDFIQGILHNANESTDSDPKKVNRRELAKTIIDNMQKHIAVGKDKMCFIDLDDAGQYLEKLANAVDTWFNTYSDEKPANDGDAAMVLASHFLSNYILRDENRTLDKGTIAAAMLMAVKVNQDVPITNKYWSDITGIDEDKLPEIERGFASGSEFDFYVSQDTIKKLFKELKIKDDTLWNALAESESTEGNHRHHSDVT
ncbi:cyclin [Marinibactrum halimedae]|uniref:Uncharacterized protein n=1 Tax=Marinibactrum halimedae TaxID=1444977 RepID=A0AA37T7A0_9GAMM|nr:cyclin [Marinibactrum halimedae]MCD9459084.1 cyclin [Marinibactrum halimedae]GLS24685.1 hypothetical protein GCM10007877_03990 [Marinibactrum halimedae]